MAWIKYLRRALCVIVVPCVLVAFVCPAAAESVTQLTKMWTVNSQTKIESFETIAGRGDDMEIYGTLSLPCGAVVTNDYPWHDSFAPFVVNGGFFGLYGASSYCPDGGAYLGQANPGLHDSGIWITFPEEVTKVGAYVCSATDSDSTAPVVFEAYDKNGKMLDDMVLSGIHYRQWATSFRGFESSTGIKAIRYDGYGDGVLRLDGLAFQPVPEPGTLLMLCLGALMLLLRRRIW